MVVLKYRFPAFEGDPAWERIGGPGRQFVVGNGGRLYGVSPNGQGVYEYTGTSDRWRWIGRSSEGLVAGEYDLYSIQPGSGDIHIYNGSPGSWSKVGGPARQFAAGGDRKLYGISPASGALYQWSGTIGGHWTRIRDAVGEVYAGGNSVYVTDASSGDIYRYNSSPNSWSPIGGPGKSFVVADDDLLYGISPDGNGVWRFCGGSWAPIGETADSIQAAGDEVVVTTDGGNNLWRHLGGEPALAHYIIVAEDNAMAEATKDFVCWKRSRGYRVSVVTLDEIELVSSGVDPAERIRNFLVDQNESGLLHYVLFVGNIDRIPTRILYPEYETGYSAYAADFYFADLHTQDWDLDDDNRWGEFYDDSFDIDYDVVVSRIPINAPVEVKEILGNIIAFEKDDGDWKKRSLQVAGFMDYDTDTAELAELVDTDFFAPNGWTLDKLYVDREQTQSAYLGPSNVNALSQVNFEQSIGPKRHGLVVLSAHGAPTYMQSHYKSFQNTMEDINFSNIDAIGDNFTSAMVVLHGCSTAAPVDDPKGLINTQLSLYNTVGNPTLKHNGQAYLQGGAVAVIGATVGSDYEPKWTSSAERGTQSLFYLFQENLVDLDMSVGDAFFQAQRQYAQTFTLERGVRTFYLTGDPSIKIKDADFTHHNLQFPCEGDSSIHVKTITCSPAIRPLEWAAHH